MSACDGSGWAGGRLRGRIAEWIDQWCADEEAEYLADFVSGSVATGCARALVWDGDVAAGCGTREQDALA